MATEFAQIDVVAADVGRTVDFYRRLGVDVPEDAVWAHDGAPHHVEIRMSNGAAVAFDSPALTKAYNASWPDGASGTVMIFSVPDRHTVDELFTKMTDDGCVGQMPPTDAFWGARYAIIDDPDGNHVGIMSPSDREHESAPGFDA
ncbi:MAG: VOC family protein [Actinomycetota bacterium]